MTDEHKTGAAAAGAEMPADQLAELVASYMADKPALTFRLAWDAYVSNEIPLAEAAAALGSTIYQFLKWASISAIRLRWRFRRNFGHRQHQNRSFCSGVCCSG